MVNYKPANAKKDEMITIPIEGKYKPLVEKAAKLDNRSMSSWIRTLLLEKLQDMNYIDDEFNVVAIEEFQAQ